MVMMPTHSAPKRGQDWTALLAAAGLETPGYAEAVQRTNEKTAKRKAEEAERQNKKTKKRTSKK